ncbi:MAG: hypothetical protein ACRDRW_18975 [Pseudonocardiaceae bacterium]
MQIEPLGAPQCSFISPAINIGDPRGGDDTTAGVLDTIPVAPTGWTDLAEIRLLGQRWLRQR